MLFYQKKILNDIILLIFYITYANLIKKTHPSRPSPKQFSTLP
jgi:hypothetical protein